jgi:hypothetical protein
MILGDGSNSKSSKGYYSLKYYTVSPRLSSAFQELALKLRYATTTKSRMHNNQKRNIIATVPCYDIGLRHSSHQKIYPKKHLSRENYNDMIYCVEVPNNTLYIKRNGYTTWCGSNNSKNVKMINEKIT